MSATALMVFGLACIIFEVIMPAGFVLFLIGVSFLIVGGATELGLISDFSYQLGAAAILMGIFWGTARRSLKALFDRGAQGGKVGGTAEGQRVQVLDDLQPGASGQGELWGSPWRVSNVGRSMLAKGSSAVVVSTEGNKLLIKSEGEEVA